MKGSRNPQKIRIHHQTNIKIASRVSKEKDLENESASIHSPKSFLKEQVKLNGKITLKTADDSESNPGTSYYESVFNLEDLNSDEEIHNYALLIKDQITLYFGPESEIEDSDRTEKIGREKSPLNNKSETHNVMCFTPKKQKIRVFLKNGIKNKFKEF